MGALRLQMPRGGQAPTHSLLDLGQEVLVAHVLHHLPLQALQALSSSCQQLRSWVRDAPEAVWRAVALNSTAPYHPALQCGSIRAYLARQAAEDAAFRAAVHGGPSAWSCSPVPVSAPDLEEAPQVMAVAHSHDRQTLAIALEGSCLQLQQLQTGKEAVVQLPRTHTFTRDVYVGVMSWHGCEPAFNPDDGSIAVLMQTRVSAESSAPPGPPVIAVISSDGSQVLSCQLPERGDIERASLSWAPNSKKLCASFPTAVSGHTLSSLCVYDDRLTLLAQVIVEGTQMSCKWSASADGFLIAPVMTVCPDWQWCLLPTVQMQAPVLSEQLPSQSDCCQLEWGPYLPGLGEVMLAGFLHKDPTLECWVPDPGSRAWTVLGTLLTGLGKRRWQAKLRHVAVTDSDQVDLYVLEPGPRLCLLHSLQDGHSLWPHGFSPDGRYLLYAEALPPSAQSGHLAPACWPAIVQVSSGIKARFSGCLSGPDHIPSGLNAVGWMVNGFWCQTEQTCFFFFHHAPKHLSVVLQAVSIS